MSSLSFSSEKGVHARARKKGGSLSRLAPSVAHGHLPVSSVLLDGPRKKGDCS